LTSPVLLRREMVEIGLRMYEKNLIVAAEGNLSVRLSGRSFLVTPAGVQKGALRSQDILEIGPSGRCAQGRPTSEWPLHQEIYRLRTDVCGICHAHAPWATAFAVAGRDLDGSLLTETAQLLPRVPVAPRAEPGTVAVPVSVSRLVTDHDAILLGSHGVVAVGPDLSTAFNILETVERLAQVTLLAELAAGNSSLDSDSIKRLIFDGR